MKRKFLLLLMFLPFLGSVTQAQNVAIKTNLLTDAVLSPNLGVEVGLKPKWTLDMVGELNLWTINQHKWKHWFFQPEARYWFCDRFAGHFLGVHAIVGQFNFGNIKNGVKFLGSDFSELTDYRFQGWGYGGGIAYGYDWILGKHWNLEAEIGIGLIHTRFKKYACDNCDKQVGDHFHHNYWGLTKLSLNIEYIF